MTRHTSSVTDTCPLARYIHTLGPVGSLVDLSVSRASQRCNIRPHTVHSEIRDLKEIGMIQAEPSVIGFYTVRILR